MFLFSRCFSDENAGSVDCKCTSGGVSLIEIVFGAVFHQKEVASTSFFLGDEGRFVQSCVFVRGVTSCRATGSNREFLERTCYYESFARVCRATSRPLTCGYFQVDMNLEDSGSARAQNAAKFFQASVAVLLWYIVHF